MGSRKNYLFVVNLSVSFIISSFFCSQNGIAQCVFPPNLLPADTTICNGVGLSLTPGPGYNSYVWDNGSINQTRIVSTAGTYEVTVSQLASNLIVNGNFEAGNTGFTTAYTLGLGGAFGLLSNAGTYAISTSPNIVHTNFSSCQDHTPTPGVQMMIVNGSGTPGANVWCQTVSVDTDTDYQFSTWVASALNDNNVAQLQFKINGSVLGTTFSPSPTACNWSQFFQVWNSGMSTSAQICIVNQNILNSGNDFMIDDISFGEVCYSTDEIVVSAIPQPVITASPNDTICVNDAASLTANSTTSNLVYTWNPGSIEGQAVSVSPIVSTVYSVIAATPEGCLSNVVSTSVLVRPVPVINLVYSTDTICAGGTVQFTATSNINGTVFNWSPETGTAGILFGVPYETTTYSVTGTTPLGCQTTVSQLIEVIPQIPLEIAGELSFCEGETMVLTVANNLPGASYTWNPGNVSGNTYTVTNQNSGQIWVSGFYQLCPLANDTVSTSIISVPTIQVPEDMLVCPETTISVTATSSLSTTVFVWSPGNLVGPIQQLSPTEPTMYTVVGENSGCFSESASFLISPTATCSIDVPNVFTPNGDNINDTFQLLNQAGIANFECVILNRWGNVIRTFNTSDFAWDGKDENNTRVTNGVYFYTITATTDGGNTIEKQGFVELK
jgi:gliding motility-associated-like protein